MTLKDDAPKSPWESATIRATVKGAVATSLALAIRVGGQSYDLPYLHDLANMGADLILLLLTLFWHLKAYDGRINATRIIRKEDQ